MENDDIVTRLREMLRDCENPNCEGCKVESDAAYEIDRLRKENEDFRLAISKQNRLNRLMNITIEK